MTMRQTLNCIALTALAAALAMGVFAVLHFLESEAPIPPSDNKATNAPATELPKTSTSMKQSKSE